LLPSGVMTPAAKRMVTVAIDATSITLTTHRPLTVVVLGVDPRSSLTGHAVVSTVPGMTTTTLPRPLTRPGSLLAVIDAATGAFYGCVVVP